MYDYDVIIIGAGVILSGLRTSSEILKICKN